MRLLNAFTASDNNKVLFILSAIHGNEPAGVLAWKRFMKVSRKVKFQLNGLVVAYIGNNEAYKKNVRFINEDMNRLFASENIWALDDKKKLHAEEKAVFKIVGSIKQILIARAMELNTPCEGILLDIHTTSAQSAPFCVVTSDFASDFWTGTLGVPVIHGLDKKMGSNSLISFFNPENLVIKTHALIVEAGQHASTDAVDFAYQCIIKTMLVFDLMNEETASNFLSSSENLESAHQTSDSEIPASLELVYRHALKPQDIFEMQPNFKNFDRVTTQTLLAHQNGKPIYSPLNAYLLMPLYQKQGSDGFFLVK